jgi:hypothetical protein
MRLASLEMWPNEPHLDNVYENKRGVLVNAVVQFTLGLVHDDSHVKQIENIVKQSSVAHHALSKS